MTSTQIQLIRQSFAQVAPISEAAAALFYQRLFELDPGLRRLFPAKVKIGAVEHIKELVNVALPGIAVNALPAAPRQIPFKVGAAYFELDRGSPHWQQMKNSGGFAIHVSDEFPNLNIELWAIRA